MGDDAGAESCDGMGADGLGDGLAVAKGVQHCGVGGEEAAPAHADGGEHGNGVSVKDAGRIEGGKEAKGRSHGAEGCHGEGDEAHIGKSKQPLKHPVNLLGKPGKDGYALTGRTVVDAAVSGAEGDEDHHGGDDKDTGDDGKAKFHAVLSAVKDGVEEAHEDTVLGGGNIIGLLLNPLRGIFYCRGIHLRPGLEAAPLHKPGGDD